MRQLTTLLIIIALFFSAKIFAQTEVEALWDLSTDPYVAITGGSSLEGDSAFWAAPLTLKDFDGGALSGPALRVYDSTGWGGGVETGPVDGRYLQFLAKPASGNSLHIDSVAFWLACYGTHGGLHAGVYWDVDTMNFGMGHLLDYDSASYGDIKGLPDVRDGASGAPHDTSFAVNTNVSDGGVFALRVYPWYNAGSASTSKYIVMWLVRIYGTTMPTTGVEDNGNLPKKFVLEQNYPNPFNPNTNISFDMPKESHVSLNVYNLLGQKVATVVDQVMGAGSHNVNFNAANLTSGIYFYQLKTDNFTSIKKMTLLK